MRQLEAKRSYWEARLPGDVGTLDWKAEITAEEPGTRLAWHSLPASQVENAGEVRFEDAPGDRGTELHAAISYTPPAGALGKAAAGLFNEVFEQLVNEDLRRVKQLLETGSCPLSRASPSAAPTSRRYCHQDFVPTRRGTQFFCSSSCRSTYCRKK